MNNEDKIIGKLESIDTKVTSIQIEQATIKEHVHGMSKLYDEKIENCEEMAGCANDMSKQTNTRLWKWCTGSGGIGALIGAMMGWLGK